MTLWAIVPVKPLHRGKSRLSDVLSEDERAALNQCMLENTLDVLSRVPKLERVLVISRDPRALTVARDHKAHTILEHGAPELNAALERATAFARKYAPGGILILPADIPLITVEDVSAMIDKAKKPPVVVISPDRHRVGTNALLLSPPGLFRYEFGPDSFNRHCQAAQQAGARLQICDSPSLALDLDTPEDLELVNQAMEPVSN
ncbi:MAG TPA: 2-phospho-L-lactate guanylyltransferase [Anaerolineales bacterium]|nr:2-phospho-L-lactate guanylyltransferase [Anaerolineales bacterium]